MSEFHPIENLINLSIEDDLEESQPTNVSKDEQSSMECTMPDCLIVKKAQGRESLDNNPFDCAQKLASRSDDPFDLVEKEACVKARYSMQPIKEVKEGKLLSISDDNIIDEEGYWHASVESATGRSADNASSMIYHSALLHDLESESPPISMSIKSTPDSCSSALESADSSANSADGYSAKLRKTLEDRKRLLKLSLSNSTFNSPLSCRSRQGDSGISTALSAAAHFSDYILATESPLKLVDDDLLYEGGLKKSDNDLENDFDADLKLLSIPMLRNLPSPVPEEPSLGNKEQNVTNQQTVAHDLSAIREKLRAKRMKACKGQDVVSLINNLKSLLCDNYLLDENKKEQANCLLKKLSTALSTEKIESNNVLCENENNSELTAPEPQPIVRQGTFDMELQKTPDNYKVDNTDVYLKIPEDTTHMTNSLQSPPKEIPDMMIKSSATYDGEPMAERENLLLPHVDAISPTTSPNSKLPASNIATTLPDVNDIIEQIGKLLEQHQMATQAGMGDHSIDSNSPESNASQQPGIINPTFIVVMPTNSVRSICRQSINSNCNDHIKDTNGNKTMRRRSQSLSIHDKLRIVQIPTRPQATPSKIEVAAGRSPIMDCSSQINVTTSDPKTPIRSTLRRNSFSSGTPITPVTSLYQGASLMNARRGQNLHIASRYSLGPSKLQERENQQQAIVHPIPRTNINAFKPDLKRRNKLTPKSSVMSSSEPLKAVIPVKKVAPMLTTTMATPERPRTGSRLPSHKVSMETSMHLLAKSGKISNTSTPMPPSRGGNKISEFPNACSTPAFATSTTKPSGTITNKNSRFSISTPSKLQQPLASTSGLNSGLKKRSLSELAKSKSPVRARYSLAGTSAAKGKQTIKQSNVSKQTISRLSMRLSSRSSLCPGTTSTNNKENKKP